MMLSVTAAARTAGVSRTTLYDKINTGELSRTKEGIDTSELMRVFGALKKSEAPDPATEKSAGEGEGMSTWLRDQLDEANRELKQTRNELTDANADLTDVRERLYVHQEAARLLEHKSHETDRKVEKVLGELRALESRGWFARLLNRVPETKSGD